MLILIVKLKYCPHCGTQIYNRYCRNQEEDIFRATSDTNHACVIDGHEREDKSNSFKPTYSYGIKLEEMVEKVLASRGYLTELRKKMIEECKKMEKYTRTY